MIRRAESEHNGGLGLDLDPPLTCVVSTATQVLNCTGESPRADRAVPDGGLSAIRAPLSGVSNECRHSGDLDADLPQSRCRAVNKMQAQEEKPACDDHRASQV